jgi:hypothetical protein
MEVDRKSRATKGFCRMKADQFSTQEKTHNMRHNSTQIFEQTDNLHQQTSYLLHLKMPPSFGFLLLCSAFRKQKQNKNKNNAFNSTPACNLQAGNASMSIHLE